jgi:arginase
MKASRGSRRAPLNQFILTPFFLDEPCPGLKALAGPDWIINEPQLPDGDRPIRVAAVYRPLVPWISQAAAAGRRPVSIAGDCLSAIGVLAGLQQAGLDPFLVWCDAHGDFNTPETSPSGFLGGMPLAMMVGRGDQTIVRAIGLRPLPETQIILTDGRDLDPGEKIGLQRSRITLVADPVGILGLVPPEASLYVHVDTDIITSAEAPAQNYPVAGGPTAEELRDVFRRLAARNRIVAVSLSSWNPDLDADGVSARVSLRALGALIAEP